MTRIGWLVWVVACSGDGRSDGPRRSDRDTGDDSTPVADTDEPTGATDTGLFSCSYTAACDAETEFCLLAVQGEYTNASVCAPLPERCHSCDCVLDLDIDQVWRDLNNGTVNCAYAVNVCAQDGEQIVVSCVAS